MKNYDDGIFFIRDYGHISLKLKEIMDANGITRNALSKKVNTRFEVINKWYNNNIENIDLDILARICFILSCDITDILHYEKPKSE